MKNYLGENIPKLGFGLMRLPMIGNEIDMEQTKRMVDTFMAKGFTYFDSAYVYIGGKSEVAMKEAIVDRYPRESFQLASKLPLWDLKDRADMERVFQESLDRAGTEYFDFYLLHAMDKDRFQKAEEIGAWDFVKEMKAQGKIRHIGFSFHDSAEVLEEALKKHGEDTEFVQLQINYIDWENENVQSRKCYEVAQKYEKPVIIMEPVKGGSLVNLPKSAQQAFRSVNPKLSIPSWAVRFCASLDGIITVLSGMSDEAQLNDNVSYMEHFEPLNAEEKKAIDMAVEAINAVPTIPCTKCRYCVDDCPQKINIPGIFEVANENKKFGAEGEKPINLWNYTDVTKEGGKASDCIQCGSCQNHCPQHIEIIEELKAIAALYE